MLKSPGLPDGLLLFTLPVAECKQARRLSTCQLKITWPEAVFDDHDIEIVGPNGVAHWAKIVHYKVQSRKNIQYIANLNGVGDLYRSLSPIGPGSVLGFSRRTDGKYAVEVDTERAKAFDEEYRNRKRKQQSTSDEENVALNESRPRPPPRKRVTASKAAASQESFLLPGEEPLPVEAFLGSFSSELPLPQRYAKSVTFCRDAMARRAREVGGDELAVQAVKASKDFERICLRGEGEWTAEECKRACVDYCAVLRHVYSGTGLVLQPHVLETTALDDESRAGGHSSSAFFIVLLSTGAHNF
jgi:hypothetical protein